MKDVILVDQGMALAQINAGALLLAFFVWGLLMAVAGVAVTWVVRGIKVAEETYEPRPFSPAAVGVSTRDSNTTTVIIPGQRRPSTPTPVPAPRPAPVPAEPDTEPEGFDALDESTRELRVVRHRREPGW